LIAAPGRLTKKRALDRSSESALPPRINIHRRCEHADRPDRRA
jgi:hypothetical protein